LAGVIRLILFRLSIGSYRFFFTLGFDHSYLGPLSQTSASPDLLIRARAHQLVVISYTYPHARFLLRRSLPSYPLLSYGQIVHYDISTYVPRVYARTELCRNRAFACLHGYIVETYALITRVVVSYPNNAVASRSIANNKMRIVLGAQEWRFVCPRNCGRSYKRRNAIWRHLKFECGIEPKFQCYVCLRRFSHKESMTKHLTAVHKSNKQ